MIRILVAFLLALAPGLAWGQSSSAGPASQNYYSPDSGVTWTPQGPPTGGSSGSPGFQQIQCGGGNVSQSSPCPTALSEPTVGTYSLTGDAVVGLTQVSLFGYTEAEIDSQAVGTGATITPQYSFDNSTWFAYISTAPTLSCRRGSDGFPVVTLATVIRVVCPVIGPYFRWNITGIASGTYSGAYSFKIQRVSTGANYTTPSPSTTAGCTTTYNLNGGTTASNNATRIASGAHVACDIVAISTSATAAWLKLYNSNAATPDCTGTAAGTLLATLPLVQNVPVRFGNSAFGVLFAAGLAYCIVGGGAAADNTNAPTGIYLSVNYQ